MTKRSRIRATLVVLVLALALGASACGDGGDELQEPTPTAGTFPSATQTTTAGGSPAATASATPETGSGTTGASGAGEDYVVQSGDTLSSIAQQFDTTVAAIVEANSIEDPDVLSVGQQLTIPTAP